MFYIPSTLKKPVTGIVICVIHALCVLLQTQNSQMCSIYCSIGFAIAERLAADGASVVVSSRKEKNVTNAVEKLKAAGYSVSGVVCHVSKATDRERLIKEAQDKFGGIDILVSNAAVNPGVGPVLEVVCQLLCLLPTSVMTPPVTSLSFPVLTFTVQI